MLRKPTVFIRPLEPRDHHLLLRWSRMPDWPGSPPVEVDTDPQALLNGLCDDDGDAILMAEPPGMDPIGLAHLSTKALPPGIAQYSVAIPDPKYRRVGWGRDTGVLTIGAAFYVYSHRQIFSLVERDNGQLIGMCFKLGFWEEPNFWFLGCPDPPESGMRVFRTTPERWMRIWGAELASKGAQVPWFNANASWNALSQTQRQPSTSQARNDVDERVGVAPESHSGPPIARTTANRSLRKVFVWDVEEDSL